MTDRRIGDNVQTLLDAAREEQRHLASSIGLDPTKLSKSMRGYRGWKSDELEAIADHFGVPIDQLFRRPKLDDLARIMGDRASRCTWPSLAAA